MQTPRVGDKVSVTVWGELLTGIVSFMKTDSSIVWVIMDANIPPRQRWFHSASLTVTATKLDARGMCPECGRDYVLTNGPADSHCYINHIKG